MLKRAKEKGYFIRCFYILTFNPDINVARIRVREKQGGHGVPENKIRERFDRAKELIPDLIAVCDIIHIYDNTEEPFRVFKKRKTEYFCWSNKYWKRKDIEKLTNICDV